MADQANSRRLSLDWWAVIVAFFVAALVKFGLAPAIPW